MCVIMYLVQVPCAVASSKALSACHGQNKQKQEETCSAQPWRAAGWSELGLMSELRTGVFSWGHPLLPAQRAVGITLDYTALSDLIKGAFLHSG